MTRVAASGGMIVLLLCTMDILGSSSVVPQKVSSAELASIRGGQACRSLSINCCPSSYSQCNCCVFAAQCNKPCSPGSEAYTRFGCSHYKAARCSSPGNTGLVPCLPPVHCGCIWKCTICKFYCGGTLTQCCDILCYSLNFAQTQPCGCSPDCPRM